MSRPVEYDFGAADDLSRALGQLNSKLNDFGNYRDTLRKTELSSWTGEKRGEYDTDYAKQVKALSTLADHVQLVRSHVDQATTDARNAKYPQTTHSSG